jgi:hypothetical protein
MQSKQKGITMTKLSTLGALSFAIFVGLTIAYGQNGAASHQNDTVGTYRVMSLVEMFEGDEEARKKIADMMFVVKKGDEPQGVQRTDLDAKDYERALNRLASKGWTLVTVNKSNYWVFRKE